MQGRGRPGRESPPAPSWNALPLSPVELGCGLHLGQDLLLDWEGERLQLADLEEGVEG